MVWTRCGPERKDGYMKLTDNGVRNAQPREKRYTIPDGTLPGLGLRITPAGHRSFILRYRHGGGRNAPERFLLLGSPDKGMSLGEARRLAKGHLASIHHGGDPARAKRELRHIPTVAQVCDRYLLEGTGAKKPSTLATDRGRIDRHIKPLLGEKAVNEVTSHDIERFMKAVAEGKTKIDIKTGEHGRAIVTGGRGTATRTTGLLGGIFSFAVKAGLRPDNPVRGVKRFRDRKNERFLSVDELARLGEALASSKANAKALNIIRLLVLSGARKNEIASLKWHEVDFERSCLRLEDSKTGQAYSPWCPALEILSNTERTNNAFVFPAEIGTGHFLGTPKVWEKIRKSANLGGVRLHDLRHSFASAALRGGAILPVIAKLLGHADLNTTSRYAHLTDDPVRLAAERTAKELDGAMKSPQVRGSSDNIVKLSQA